MMVLATERNSEWFLKHELGCKCGRQTLIPREVIVILERDKRIDSCMSETKPV